MRGSALQRASVRLHVCVRRCRGRPRIASLWDSLTTAGVFPRVSRRRPFTGADLREIRPPNFCFFYRSPPLPRFFALSVPFRTVHGSCVYRTRCNAPVLLEQRSRYAKIMGNTRGRIAAWAGIRGTSPRERWQSDARCIMFTGTVVPSNHKYLQVRANAMTILVAVK